MGRADLVGVVEAAYGVGAEGHAWLQALVDVARPAFDQGHGAAAIVADASGAVPAPPRNLDFAMSGISLETLATLQPVGEAAASAEVSGRFRRAGSVSTFIKTLGPKQRSLLELTEPSGIADVFYLIVGDTARLHATFAFPSPKPVELTPKFKRSAAQVAAHLEAGFRMLERSWLPATENAGPSEAVLDPNGKLHHAEGDARDANNREALRDAVLRAESARGAMRRDDPDRALDYWKALVAGRWSIIDHFDSDGRRYLIARPNEPRGARLSALGRREAQVLDLASRGHSHKLIGYELGLSVSAIASYMASGMEKLGIKSRRELIRVLGARRSENPEGA